MKVKPKDLIFPLNNDSVRYGWGPDGEITFAKKTWLDRWVARRMSALILNSSCKTYQFGGYTGFKRLAYEMVDAPKEQIVHWLLREAGYACCEADIIARTALAGKEQK